MRMRKEQIKRIISIVMSVLFVGVLLFCVYYYSHYGRQSGEITQDNNITIESQESPEEVQQSQQAKEPPEKDRYQWEGYLDIAAAVKGADRTRNIKLYVQNENCYLFLPAYAADTGVTWQFDEEQYMITVDGRTVRNGNLLERTEEQQICIRKAADEEETEYKLVVMQSESIPAVYIDTDSQAMTYLEQDREHEEQGEFLCISGTGEVDSEGGIDKISGRGYSSFHASKKSYTVTLENAQDVLGMGSAYKWVLQANAFDLSRMRNKTAYDMARDMGVPYAVDSGYADIYFNGEYAGNYLLCEKIEVAQNRMDIGDAYLLEGIFASRSEEEINYFQGKAGWYEVKNPVEITEDNLLYLQTYTDDIVDLIEGCDTEEEYKQLQQYIDIDSFAKMYILDELTNEPDLNRSSTFYFILDEGTGQKMYAGPVWDYDRSMGNVEGARYEYLTCLSPGLPEKLFQCEYFRRDVTERFRTQYEQIIRRYLDQTIWEYYDRIYASVEMDGIRWGARKNNSYMNFNDMYSTYEDAVRYMTYYLNVRYGLLQGYLYEPDQYHQIEFVNSGSRQEYDSRRYWLRDGEKVPAEVLEYLQSIFSCDGWTYEDGTHCQVNRPVLGDMKVYSYVDESKNEDVPTETEVQEPESSGYSKRFVIFCMMASAGCAGVCGIILGCFVWKLRFGKKEKKNE